MTKTIQKSTNMIIVKLEECEYADKYTGTN